MLQAMLAAPLGDDVFGDDPSVNALQEKIAGCSGSRRRCSCPPGTQSNLCGVLSHCQRGDEYIVGQMQHCYRWEGGGAAVFGSVQPQPLNHQPDGSLAIADIEAAIKPDDPHFARTRLLAWRTHWAASCCPSRTCSRRRPWRAAGTGHPSRRRAACSMPPWRKPRPPGGDARSEARRIAGLFDSVSVCFSKGLGAPVGSALCGTKDFIARAGASERWRAVPCASPAAGRRGEPCAGPPGRGLAQDHALARRLAEGLEGIEGADLRRCRRRTSSFVDLLGPAT
jgi:threonine aldolase